MLINTEQATEQLAVSRTTLHRLVKSGKIRVIKVGKCTRFEDAEIKSFIEQLKKERCEKSKS